ncbi:hypothetical protein KIH87_05705 [Paraneptunicella aestuarii]|uniref:sorbitol dehydrogenase family protein n=1 Tax=Paraneptunicella aestuarii TaxID=2831148 RepID=UPI001E5BEF56|nr:sorbitol dehydrogenase family protein [Paraneptunicella aestuarii]UAA39849.1 hypothetical protein KIH87_05705 [Paraneptunicella aestuarii]
MQLNDFYRISAVLTGYDEVKLIGTGVGQSYFDVLTGIIPESIITALNTTFTSLPGSCPDTLNTLVRQEIMANEALGPVARNIIKMWYCSTWFPMPDNWVSKYAVPTQTPGQYQDVEFIISDDAYIQGLAWDAVHSHPMGAKQPGFATWSFKPEDITHSPRTHR